ncbi:hypothetical protein R6Q57_025132 [Mikania cordata]
MQQNQKENRASKGMMINKIKRENKCIPDLIFQIEDYEKYLILLSKATKINLLRHAKRSTARDFRITEPQNIPQEENRPNQETLVGLQDNTHQEDVLNKEPQNDDLVQDSDNAETGTPLAADDSDSEDENIILNSKKSRIVYDSDDEA